MHHCNLLFLAHSDSIWLSLTHSGSLWLSPWLSLVLIGSHGPWSALHVVDAWPQFIPACMKWHGMTRYDNDMTTCETDLCPVGSIGPFFTYITHNIQILLQHLLKSQPMSNSNVWWKTTLSWQVYSQQVSCLCCPGIHFKNKKTHSIQ